MVALKGKAALVTGGAQGIGKAVCQAFLNKGIKVCIADVDVSTGQETLKELQKQHGDKNVVFKKCDVSDEKEFNAVLLDVKATFGRLDILVNNAGIMGESNWQKTILINLNGVMVGTMLAFQHLADDKGKKDGTMVINTASILSRKPGYMFPAYTASKHGVAGWTASWGHEKNVESTGVKVNAVCPHETDTVLHNNSGSCSINPAETAKWKQNVAGKPLETSTVANAYVQLLEEDCSGKLLAVSVDKGAYLLEYEYFC